MSTTPSRPIARDHCLAPERIDSPVYAGRYRRLLEDLPPLEVDEESLHALGRPGGPCDAGIEFVDDADDADARVAAVWPFFGQFVAHDITADRSPLGHRATRARSATSAPRGRTSRASTAPARSARRTCTSATTRPGCCSGRAGTTSRATTRESHWSATLATTRTCS